MLQWLVRHCLSEMYSISQGQTAYCTAGRTPVALVGKMTPARRALRIPEPVSSLTA